MTTSTFTRPPLREFVSRRYADSGPLVGWLVFEPIGGALAYLFAAVPAITPSMVTVLGGVSGAVGAAVLAVASSWSQVVLAAVLLLLNYSLDCADGQLARATGRTSARGAWLDVVVDASVIAFVAAALAHALYTDGGLPWEVLVAGAYGASRAATLFTSTSVQGRKAGPMQLSAAGNVVRAAYGALVDTPFVYAVLCLARPFPTALRLTMLAVAALTIGQVLIQAHRHLPRPSQAS